MLGNWINEEYAQKLETTKTIIRVLFKAEC